MKAKMTVHKLIKELQDICEDNEVSPKKVYVNFKWNTNVEGYFIKSVKEDTYDSKTGEILKTVSVSPFRKY